MNDGHLDCSECGGIGLITIGDRDFRCPECNGWGRMLDLDSYELPAEAIS